MNQVILIKALKHFGIKRANIREEVDGFYVDIWCAPFLSLVERTDFQQLVKSTGLIVDFFRLKWHENWFKRFQYKQIKGPYFPRHIYCKCWVGPAVK